LLTLSDHPDYDPLVHEDETGDLHWAGNNYVLVFNGDLVDRGPHNESVLTLVVSVGIIIALRPTATACKFNGATAHTGEYSIKLLKTGRPGRFQIVWKWSYFRSVVRIVACLNLLVVSQSPLEFSSN
jgi:hypothetical protein